MSSCTMCGQELPARSVADDYGDLCDACYFEHYEPDDGLDMFGPSYEPDGRDEERLEEEGPWTL